MSLRDMVKRYSADAAIATVATSATHDGKNGLTVAKVAGVAVADSQNEKLHLERWHWFLSLAYEHGIHPDVVAAEFPSEQDRLDVVEPPEHTDELLRRCMAINCDCVRVRRRQATFERGEWVPVLEATP